MANDMTLLLDIGVGIWVLGPGNWVANKATK